MADTSLAEQECSARGWSFGDSFANQYVITPKSDRVPPGWKTTTLGDWRISHCPRLPISALTQANGTVVALVLGYAILPDGLMLDGKHKLPISAKDKDRLQKAEDHIAMLAGRYVALVSIGKTARVYPDPVCSMGPVYHTASRRLGASLTLILDRPVIDNPEVPARSVADGQTHYLFGHTPDAEVRRIRSNHFIDLSDFSMHRHWPLRDTCFDLADHSHRDLSGEIAEKLRLNMGALIGRYPTALPLTGGTDSRLLLAAGKDFLDQVGQIFVYSTNWSNSVDSQIAQEIAQTMCLPLRIISDTSPRFAAVLDADAFRDHMALRFLRGGLEPDTSELGSIRAMLLVPHDALVLRGNVAEMTRALRWHRSVYDDPHHTGFALEKLNVIRDRAGPFYEKWQAEFLAWKASLPETALPRIYDLLHTELWLPHTNSGVYIREAHQTFINPFNDRHLIHLTSRIPPMVRKRRRVVNDIIYGYAKEIWRIDYKDQRNRAALEAS